MTTTTDDIKLRYPENYKLRELKNTANAQYENIVSCRELAREAYKAGDHKLMGEHLERCFTGIRVLAELIKNMQGEAVKPIWDWERENKEDEQK